MKKIVLSLATLALSFGLFAQEKEIEAAFSAIESNDVSTAKSELAKVSSQIDSNTISPDSKAKYYYTSGQVALREGNSIEAARLFGEMSKYENGVVYSARNKSTKQTEYFQTKAEADAAIAKGDYTRAKEEVLSPNLITKVDNELRKKAENVLQQGNTAYQAKDMKKAGDKFLEASYLVNAIGGDSGIFKYNAALSYHQGQHYQEAFNTYKELIQEGYTGVSSSWVGKNNETGEEVTLASKDDAETQQKLGLVSGIREVKTPSVEKDLASYALSTLMELKKYDDLVDQISDKYPQDAEIQTLVGNILHNSGNTDKFLEKLVQNTKIDPKNPSNYYNIGVIQMNAGNDVEAIEAFEQAIRLNPDFKNAYTNLALVKIKPEVEYVEIINSNLGNTSKEKQTFKEYSEKRKNLYRDVIPYLEKAFNLDKTDYEAAKTLRQAYQAAEMFDKEDEMRAIERSLQN
ncbi:MAG: tetratricopeptide repeat protein [Flavobacteriaceae bacterium]|jgi:tetratricopeptide (TPR) repeat protein|nr:tetratricopeptide repeat protein [Flavobacteriaceae bacterium]